MDIRYLLWLQKIRDSLGTGIPEFFLALTKFAVSIWPLVIVAFVFWVFDRKEGRRLLGALSLSMLLNGFLKVTFTVYRPWIRDTLVEPYGDAKVSAGGYSFPSGHTMYYVPTIGGVGWWQWHRNKIISIICFVSVALVMFSRNYLGCHTPQDVIVGLAMGILCIFLSGQIEKWIDGGKNRGKIAAIIAIVLSIGLVFYYFFKPYPIDLNSDGTIIADPWVLMADSFEGLGAIIAFYCARLLEQKGFDFDKEMHWKDRFIISVIAIIPWYFWRGRLFPLIAGLNPYIGHFLVFGVEIFYVMVIVPWVMGLIHKSGFLNRDKSDS